MRQGLVELSSQILYNSANKARLFGTILNLYLESDGEFDILKVLCVLTCYLKWQKQGQN